MGLRKINDGSTLISPEEWQRMEMRRHSAWRWFITLCEIGAMVGFVWVFVWLLRWLEVI